MLTPVFSVLQLDENHPLIQEQLTKAGYLFDNDYKSSYQEVIEKIENYQGIIIRSRLPIDANFLQKASHLKWIARLGAGLENIDQKTAKQLEITLINSPEGNRDALAEHALALLLNLMNRIFIAQKEVRNGIWKREENRGEEILGKTIGLIGYGYMGKAFAKRLSSFGARVIFHDIKPNLSDENAEQVTIHELQESADIISLHLPLDEKTKHYLNASFFEKIKKNIYLINTARGENIATEALLDALRSGKVKAAGLDVLEYEQKSFESIENNPVLASLLQMDNVIITPHIAGWTIESKEKLAQIIVDKIIQQKG